MGIVGGDVPALLGFANDVQARRSSIEQACIQLGALVESAEWVGPDREAFLNEWNSRHSASLLGVVGELATVVTQVVGHARKQEEASQ